MPYISAKKPNNDLPIVLIENGVCWESLVSGNPDVNLSTPRSVCYSQFLVKQNSWNTCK